jgi:hypothetical protein
VTEAIETKSEDEAYLETFEAELNASHDVLMRVVVRALVSAFETKLARAISCRSSEGSERAALVARKFVKKVFEDAKECGDVLEVDAVAIAVRIANGPGLPHDQRSTIEYVLVEEWKRLAK